MDEKTLLTAGVKVMGLFFMVWGLIALIQAGIQKSALPTLPGSHVGLLFILPIIEIAVGFSFIRMHGDIVDWLFRK